MFICVCWMFRDGHPVRRQMRPIEVARIIQIIHDVVRQRRISQTFGVSQRVVSTTVGPGYIMRRLVSMKKDLVVQEPGQQPPNRISRWVFFPTIIPLVQPDVLILLLRCYQHQIV